MKDALIKLLVFAAIVAVTSPVALGLSIAIFDTGCVFDLCGLEGLVYGGLAIWAILVAIGLGVWVWVKRRP